jgi:hypothetical protein
VIWKIRDNAFERCGVGVMNHGSGDPDACTIGIMIPGTTLEIPAKDLIEAIDSTLFWEVRRLKAKPPADPGRTMEHVRR